MPSKIYHKDQGFVLTSDDTEIKDMLKRGGIDCTNKPNDYIRRLIHPEFYKNEEQSSEIPSLQSGKVEEVTQEEVIQEPKRRGRPRAN